LTVRKHHEGGVLIHPQGLTGLQDLGPEKGIGNTGNSHPADVHLVCADHRPVDPAPQALAPVAALSFVVVDESERWRTFLRRRRRSGGRGSALRGS